MRGRTGERESEGASSGGVFGRVAFVRPRTRPGGRVWTSPWKREPGV